MTINVAGLADLRAGKTVPHVLRAVYSDSYVSEDAHTASRIRINALWSKLISTQHDRAVRDLAGNSGFGSNDGEFEDGAVEYQRS